MSFIKISSNGWQVFHLPLSTQYVVSQLDTHLSELVSGYHAAARFSTCLTADHHPSHHQSFLAVYRYPYHTSSVASSAVAISNPTG